MRKYFFTILALVVSPMLIAQQGAGRSTTNFDKDWKFFRGDSPKAWQSNLDDGSWRTLDVPHDWSIELENAPGGGNGGFFPTHYRKILKEKLIVQVKNQGRLP